MYEIWLALNIVWEIALDNVAVAIGIVALLLVLFAVAIVRSGAAWRRGLHAALAVGAVVAVISLWAVPSATLSSLDDMKYWIDWATLAGVALAIGAIAAALAWPLAAMLRRPSQ